MFLIPISVVVIITAYLLTSNFIIKKERENLLSPIISYENTNSSEIIAVKIKYPEEITVREYSIDGTNWEKYKNPITIDAGETVTLYARGFDNNGNQTKIISKKITNPNSNANKDKIKYNPSVCY